MPWGELPLCMVTQRGRELAEGAEKDAEGLPRGGERSVRPELWVRGLEGA